MHVPLDAASLQALQAPLTELYRQDPDEAVVHLTARADWRDPGITTSVDVWSGRTRAGLHPAAGGGGDNASSGDMLLEAVLASTGVTMRSVATAMGLAVRDVQLYAEAEFDARGTLGVERDVPVGLTGISVTAVLDTDATNDDLTQLAQSTERYCIVGQSLATPPTITVRRSRA